MFFLLFILLLLLVFYSSLTVVKGLVDIRVINLEHRKDRLVYMKTQMDNFNLKWKRFDAISFEQQLPPPQLHPETKMEFEPIKKFLDKSSFAYLNWGSLGCWQSHLQLMMEIYDEPKRAGPFLILEDDVEIQSTILRYLSKSFLHNELPSNWMVLFFDWEDPSIAAEYNGFKRVTSCTRASAYMIRDRESLEKLIESSNTKELQLADVHWNDKFKSGLIVAYLMKHRVIRHNFDYGSNIKKMKSIKNK